MLRESRSVCVIAGIRAKTIHNRCRQGAEITLHKPRHQNERRHNRFGDPAQRSLRDRTRRRAEVALQHRKRPRKQHRAGAYGRQVGEYLGDDGPRYIRDPFEPTLLFSEARGRRALYRNDIRDQPLGRQSVSRNQSGTVHLLVRRQYNQQQRQCKITDMVY